MNAHLAALKDDAASLAHVDHLIHRRAALRVLGHLRLCDLRTEAGAARASAPRERRRCQTRSDAMRAEKRASGLQHAGHEREREPHAIARKRRTQVVCPVREERDLRLVIRTVFGKLPYLYDRRNHPSLQDAQSPIRHPVCPYPHPAGLASRVSDLTSHDRAERGDERETRTKRSGAHKARATTTARPSSCDPS